MVERERGIYEVEGYPLPVQVIVSGQLGLVVGRIGGRILPVQVIVSGQLGVTENLWLRGLEGGLKAEVLGVILEESGRRDQGKLGAYLHAVLEANPKAVKEVTEMRKKKLTLTDVLVESGLTAEWEKRGEDRGETRGKAKGKRTAWEQAISLLKQGYTVEQLEQMDPVNAPFV